MNHVLLFSLAVSVETQAELFTLYPGNRLELSCDAREVNWTKDHVAVVDGEHTHIRDGQLRIETVELTDSGLYGCTTSGNHSVFFNVTGRAKETAQIFLCSIFCLSTCIISSVALVFIDDEF